MSASTSIAVWLIHIQGKNISESILQSIKAELVGITSSKKMLYDSIVGIINKNGYTVDPKYVYENILGLHIAPLDLATENIIIREFEVIRELIGDRGCKQVPNAYMLQKISEKYDLTIGNTVDFPVDRKRHYDIILTAYIHNQAS
jgi:hypothetical protein